MEPTSQPAEEKFSMVSFTVSVGVIVASYITLLSKLLPDFWARQCATGIWNILLVATLFHLFNGGFEFFFHRYILHSAVFKWFKKFYDDHTLHHGLTRIFLTREKTIVNRYPIVDEKQYASSFFPYWGLAGFTLFFSPLTWALQWLFPNAPVVLGSFIAITFSYCLYECLHAVEHVDYEQFWKKFVENPRFGSLGKKIYGFHAFHHANIMCNMAISGCFGLPLFDWLFGTYKQPSKLLLNGVLANDEDLSAPKPCPLIAWIDGLVEKRKHRARK